MCGRYTLTVVEGMETVFELDERPPLLPRYNIAPTQQVAVVRDGASGRQMQLMQWGWAPDFSGRPEMLLINARSETAYRKNTFRDSFRARRCLIPADGFIEWKRSGRVKQPYHIQLSDGELFAFAGLWESWKEADRDFSACVILTTSANSLVSPIHDRMPVILRRADYGGWLSDDTPVSRLNSLLTPYRAAAMKAVAVDRRINSPHNDDPACLAPGDTPLQGLLPGLDL